MSFDPFKHFKLLNVRLKSSQFTAADNAAEMRIDSSMANVQTRTWCTHRHVARVIDGAQVRCLLVNVNAGVRLMSGDPAESGAIPIHTLESCFVAEFLEREACPAAELDQFCNRNGLHVVWPFWRQHVMATLQSASLPTVVMPLLAPIGVSKAKA